MNSEQINKERASIYKKAIALNGGNTYGCRQFLSEEEKNRIAELAFREIIIACHCYGDETDIFDRERHFWGDAGHHYGYMKLGNAKALEVYKDQKEYIRQHAEVITNSRIDPDGTSYNSIIWK